MPRYFHERGDTRDEVINRIHSKYGEQVRILVEKNVPASGIRGWLGKEQVECSGYVATGDEAAAIRKNRDEQARAAILASAGKSDRIARSPAEIPSKDDSANDSEGITDVLRELRDLKSHLAVAASTPPPERFPVLSEAVRILEENDFEPDFIEEIIESLRMDFKAAELEDREMVHTAIVERIAESISFSAEQEKSGPRVFVLVGPTGVGKTTTIAKLAAVYGLAGGPGKSDVRIITVDSFRIGARAQVETYGEIMGIPVLAVDDYDELRKQVALASDSDLLLIDTIGKSPRDVVKIDEMRNLLSACGKGADVHLALSATTKTADLKEIMDQFEPFGYTSVVLTKLDETSRIGNVISVLAKSGASVSYLTDGQSVPVDISLASPARLLARVRGLDYDESAFKDTYKAADLTANWR